MTTIKRTGIELRTTSIQNVNIHIGFESGDEPHPGPNKIVVKQYQLGPQNITDPTLKYSLLLTSDDSSKNPFFYKGCVYLPEKDELYAMSDLLQSTSSSALPAILISKILLQRDRGVLGDYIPEVEWMKLRPPSSMPMPAGACRYRDGILFCSQGALTPNSGGLWYMPWGKPPTPILTAYFQKPFNSIQSVVEDQHGALWFTDASIGFEQEIRPKPKLPNQVYRYDPATRDLRAVADGFSRPMGIALGPDGNTLYVTDTGAARPNGGNTDTSSSATIYAFDVAYRSGAPFLINRRVFAYVKEGVPTSVLCDSSGNVFAACGDGVEIWNPVGTSIGLIEVFGGCTSICFGRNRELFICAKQRLWWVQLDNTIFGT